MRRFLLIAAIVLILAGIVSLLFSGLLWYSFFHVMDGSAALYARLRRQKWIYLGIGIALLIMAILLLKIRKKID